MQINAFMHMIIFKIVNTIYVIPNIYYPNINLTKF